MVALPDHKAWAELVAVPATSVFALPPGMSYLDAAAITMNYTVAYILLFELAHLTPGKSLLLHSAGGGVVSWTNFFFIFVYSFVGEENRSLKRYSEDDALILFNYTLSYPSLSRGSRYIYGCIIIVMFDHTRCF